MALMALWFRQVREEEALEAQESHGALLLAEPEFHMMDKSKLMEALQRLPISFGMAMGVRGKCRKVAERYDVVPTSSQVVSPSVSPKSITVFKQLNRISSTATSLLHSFAPHESRGTL